MTCSTLRGHSLNVIEWRPNKQHQFLVKIIAHIDCTFTSCRPPLASTTATQDALWYECVVPVARIQQVLQKSVLGSY